MEEIMTGRISKGRVVVFPAAIPPVEGKTVFFLLSFRQIVRVLRNVPVFTVPFAPSYLRGIARWNDAVLPVVRLEESLCLAGTSDYAARRLIVIRLADGGKPIMVQCREGIKIVSIPLESRPVSPGAWIGRRRFLRGLYRTDDAFYVVADVDRLMRSAETSDGLIVDSG